MPFAIRNLMDGQEPQGRIVRDESDLVEGEILTHDELGPGRVWDATNKRLRNKTTAEKNREQQDRTTKETDYQTALTTLRNSSNPDTQALVKVLAHRGVL